MDDALFDSNILILPWVWFTRKRRTL